MTDNDVAFWRQHCLPAFSSLLKSTGTYTPEQQESHIKFFTEKIIPCIGPKPTVGAAPLLAHTGSVLETSINFCDAANPIVRFIFQPMDSIKGIPEDLGADMTWFRRFASEFCMTEEEKKTMEAKLPELAYIPQCLLGFDILPGSRSMKGYFSPLLKHMLSGGNTDELIFKVMRSLAPGPEGFGPALDLLEAFRSTENVQKIDVVGLDCIDPNAGARIKLYTRLHPHENNFSQIEHHLTLGGRLTDEQTLGEVELLRDIWHLLLDEPEGFTEKDESKKEIGPIDPHSGIMISWEVSPGKPNPSPKLYVPRWKFSSSNAGIGKNYEKIFDKWNWAWGADGQFKRAIEQAL